ncbi:MAG: four helix bundle protein [Oligoflexia bacterium]|nr:four helix bundle protein [Oligoflexia bacterium]
MKNFRTLDLAVEFYAQVKKLKIEAPLRDQLMRASSSIALNLSEGNAKGSPNEKRHFFQTALGSLRECQTIFKLSDIKGGEAVALSDTLGASLYKLVNSELKASPSFRKNSSRI